MKLKNVQTKTKYRLTLDERELGEMRYALYVISTSSAFTGSEREYFTKLYGQFKQIEEEHGSP